MEDASSNPEGNARAALPALRYVLEPEWPHRAVAVDARREHGADQDTAEAGSAAARPVSAAG